jgi:hypothetical protein
MARKSSASLAIVTALPSRLLPAPEDLSPEEACVWARVVATKPSDWWDGGSAPLLAQYARATVQSEMVAELVRRVSLALVTAPDELARYRDLRKIQAQLSGELNTLARSMRLTQQSKYRADKADTTSRKASGNRPWITHDIIDSD